MLRQGRDIGSQGEELPTGKGRLLGESGFGSYSLEGSISTGVTISYRGERVYKSYVHIVRSKVCPDYGVVIRQGTCLPQSSWGPPSIAV